MPFRTLRWGMSEAEARAALGFAPVINTGINTWPPSPWTCTQWGFAFGSTSDSDTRRRCEARTPGEAMSPDEERSFYASAVSGRVPRDRIAAMDVPFALAAEPITVVVVAGNPVPGSTAQSPSSDGSCERRQVLRDGTCQPTEEVVLLFWRERLFGISFIPSGTNSIAPPDDPRVLSAALDERLGVGTDANTLNGLCVLREPPAGGHSGRCRVWQNSRTHVELHRFTVGSRDRVRVSYADRRVITEIDALEAQTRSEAVRSAEAARANSATEAAGRL